MKSFVIVLAFLSLACTAFAAAPDSTATPGARPNSLHAGAWALQYSFLGSFNDNQVSAKRHLTPRSAIRLGLSFSTNSRTQDESLDTTVTLATQHIESDGITVRSDIVLQHYAKLSLPAQFYFAVGPFVEYSHYDEKGRRDAVADFGLPSDETEKQERVSGGATARVGAEWFASRAFSLFTEYGLEGGYTKSTDSRTTNDDGAAPALHDQSESSGWFLGTGSARFGVGFYF
jgi:opacity protein-like surface antigen